MILYGIFRSGNLLTLEYLLNIEHSKIRLFSGFKYFKIGGHTWALHQDPIWGFNLLTLWYQEAHNAMYHRFVWNVRHALAKQWRAYTFFPESFKTFYSQIFRVIP